MKVASFSVSSPPAITEAIAADRAMDKLNVRDRLIVPYAATHPSPDCTEPQR